MTTSTGAEKSFDWKLFAVPALAWAVFFWKYNAGGVLPTILCIPALVHCTLQGVHHAEVIAHRIGEPFGSLVLALAVTLIEVALIISMMVSSGPDGGTLARDTVFAAVMIILTAMIGTSLLAGSMKFGEQTYKLQGINSVLTVLLPIAVLTMVLPNFTLSAKGPYYSNHQLVYISIVSLVLYGSFVFVQNFRHKDFFINPVAKKETEEEVKPSKKEALSSLLLLFICLGAVIMLAKALAPDLDTLIERMNAPRSLAGIVIAMIILLPEGLSAYRAARRDELQTSLNLALGSALASICLTIPSVAVFSIIYKIPLELGLDAKSIIMFTLSFLVVSLSFKTGKTIILQGIVLLVIFFSYVFLTIFP